MKIYIDTWKQDDCTIGRLVVSGSDDDFHIDPLFKCFTLELPWLDNQKKISCIPAGKYKARKHISPSLGPVIHLYDVQDRTWIYIHKGNYTSQIQGCILVGDSIQYINNDSIPDVGSSKKAFDRLMELMPDEIEVEIFRA